MICKHFKIEYQKLISFVFACVIPLVAICSTGHEISEKRMEVAMRMIGHEVLMNLGDCESRIMPIEKIDELYNSDTYRVSFEFEFGFDPGDIVSIIGRVMTENQIASDYLVEVVQCETKEVVHSFEVRDDSNPGMVPCGGRILPEDCYSLLITILHNNNPATNVLATSSDGSSLTSSETKESNLFRSALLIALFLFLIGFVGYFNKKKNPVDIDPNLILIGASQFDKRNMALSFENNRVELSNKEAELLSLLHTSANAPIEREVILQRVWGDDGDYVGRTLDVFISKLRKKLEADSSVKIVNLRGVGYKLVVDVPK